MYAICIKDFDELGNSTTAYWTTRVNNTDNYSYDREDATRFINRVCAYQLMKVLDLVDDHFIEEV